jgi:hypothetical protein
MMDRYMSRTTPHPTTAVPVRQNATPVNVPAAAEKRQAFADRLEKLEQRNNNKKPAKGEKADKTSDNQAAARPQDSAKPETMQGRVALNERDKKPAMPLDEAMNASAQSGEPIIAPALRGAAMQVQAVTATAEALPAHIERMASAIQELHAKGGTAEYQLKLPFGATQIETVILGRDAQGRINIQLQSAAILPPQVIAQMSSMLTHRLRQKDLRVGDVKFTSGKVHGKGQK